MIRKHLVSQFFITDKSDSHLLANFFLSGFDIAVEKNLLGRCDHQESVVGKMSIDSVGIHPNKKGVFVGGDRNFIYLYKGELPQIDL